MQRRAHDGLNVEVREVWRCRPGRNQISDAGIILSSLLTATHSCARPALGSSARLVQPPAAMTTLGESVSHRTPAVFSSDRNWLYGHAHPQCFPPRATGSLIPSRVASVRTRIAAVVEFSQIILIPGLSVPALVWASLPAAGRRGPPRASVRLIRTRVLGCSGGGGIRRLLHVGWPRTRLMGVTMGNAIAAAFVAIFPDLVENEIMLVASAGLVEAYLRRLASKPNHTRTTEDALVYELPVTGFRWAFESRAWEGPRVLVVHASL
ncbi:hypothetical protein DFH09DRAFT_1270813 [Mycena vulgaris]|nr:hypothetical protein DFH09DRAFT_1270813 [Mycena vulgaris]